MFSRITILCFAASYAIVLALEISRLVFRSGIRGAFMMGWAAAGLVAHSLFLYNRAAASTGVPLSSWQDWVLVAAWLLMVVYLYLVYYHPQNAFGVFLLPLVLGLIVAAWFLIDSTPFARKPASQIWGGIHGMSIGLAAASMLLGFASGIMYLWQDHRLKKKTPPRKGLQLPSLEWLQRVNRRTLVVSSFMLGIGVVTGMLLNLINRNHPSGQLPWFDPLVLGTVLIFIWVLTVTILCKLFQLVWSGRVVALLAMLSFPLLVIIMTAGLLMKTQHGGRLDNPPRLSPHVTMRVEVNLPVFLPSSTHSPC